MSKNSKAKKSTTKKRKLDTSKLIPFIAAFEALILVAVTTFSWFYLSAKKSMNSGIITVQANSGLEIDFKDADKTSFVNIFDYIDKNTFYFEPASSVDGRNIYFPTSGTFNSTTTTDMVFREGTVNDINSKYINIDFSLKNTDLNNDVKVYLSNDSFFRISNDSGKNVNGKALRMALYNNDGNSGDVSSHLVSSFHKEVATEAATEDPSAYKVYFTKPSGWSTPKIYVWHEADNDGNVDKDIPLYDWPGVEMTWVVGDLYQYTFTNEDGYYDAVLFYGGSSSNKTGDLTLTNNKWYQYSSGSTTTSDPPEMATVYFLKPSTSAWSGTPKCAVGTNATDNSNNVLSDPLKVGGESMKQVTTGVYSYTFPNTYNYVQFLSDDLKQKSKLTKDSPNLSNGKLYYFPDTSYGASSGQISTVPYSSSSIYFYNSLGWSDPYINVCAFPNSNYKYDIQMISLSGGLFYVPLSTAYLNDVIAGMTNIRILGGQTDDPVVSGTHYVSEMAGNCQAYFYDHSDNTKRTVTFDTKSEHVFRALSAKTGDNYNVQDEDYSAEVHTTSGSYAVISPGVSAGFQRSANPVNAIQAATGSVTSIIPAFASSFDDYIMGSNNPVFTIGAGKAVNMSMIVWLEGTDEHCTAENYAGKNINLYLEFSTVNAGDNPDSTYVYQVVDDTLETWTGDTITSGSMKIDPVMQLYDATNDRGYLMKAASYSGSKVKVWECLAPQSLITDSTKKHSIEFRRVNPYNEDQVWNYWDAGYANDYLQDARTGNTVTFTIFADGSPERSVYGSTMKIGSSNQTHTLPERSCGGLWGAFNSTDTLRVYDGRKVKLVIDDTEKASGEGDALNFGYTYQYPLSGKTVTIEYKASPVSRHFFEIAIPTSVFTQAYDSYFVHYDKLKDYAINSVDNNTVVAAEKWSAGDIQGLFYEFDEEYDFDAGANKSTLTDQHSYWGADIMYVQVRNSVSDTYASDDGFNQIHFYKKNTDIGFYSYLYENDHTDIIGNDNKCGFVAVIPVGAEYDKCMIERALNSNHNTKIRYTGEIAVSQITGDSRSVSHSGAVRWNGVANDDHLITIYYDFAKFYYKNEINNPNYDAPDKVHVWSPDGWYNMTKKANSDVWEMTTRSDMSIQFRFNDGGYKYTQEYHVWDWNGKHIGSSSSWSYDKMNLTISTSAYGGNITNTETGYSSYSTSLPRYEAKATADS